MKVVECSVWPLFWQIHRPSYDVHYMEEITEDIDLREKKTLLLLNNDPGFFFDSTYHFHQTILVVRLGPAPE